ncbi:hypothetical protein ACTXMW_16835 [Brachybacterium paraconglomeratum]
MFIQDQTELVSWGGNTEERRRGRTPVAESQVTISLKDVETMDRCLDAIEESDGRLAAPPKDGRELPAYDWTIVWREENKSGGGKVHFGVVWYDEDYYQNHKNTFEGRFHGHLFEKLGVSVEDFNVTHWKKEPVGA